MKNALLGTLVVAVVLVLVGQAFSNGKMDEVDDVAIMVSPQTLLLSSVQGGEVSVHSNIPLSLVDRASVELSGIPAISVGADSRGALEAKFNEAAVKAIVAAPRATLTLTGAYAAGGTFAASDTVRVVD